MTHHNARRVGEGTRKKPGRNKEIAQNVTYTLAPPIGWNRGQKRPCPGGGAGGPGGDGGGGGLGGGGGGGGDGGLAATQALSESRPEDVNWS